MGWVIVMSVWSIRRMVKEITMEKVGVDHKNSQILSDDMNKLYITLHYTSFSASYI